MAEVRKWNFRKCRNIPPLELLKRIDNSSEGMMNKRLTISLIAASLLASSAAFAQSTTATGAAEGARTGGAVGGPVGAGVGGQGRGRSWRSGRRGRRRHGRCGCWPRPGNPDRRDHVYPGRARPVRDGAG